MGTLLCHKAERCRAGSRPVPAGCARGHRLCLPGSGGNSCRLRATPGGSFGTSPSAGTPAGCRALVHARRCMHARHCGGASRHRRRHVVHTASVGAPAPSRSAAPPPSAAVVVVSETVWECCGGSGGGAPADGGGDLAVGGQTEGVVAAGAACVGGALEHAGTPEEALRQRRVGKPQQLRLGRRHRRLLVPAPPPPSQPASGVWPARRAARSGCHNKPAPGGGGGALRSGADAAWPACERCDDVR